MSDATGDGPFEVPRSYAFVGRKAAMAACWRVTSEAVRVFPLASLDHTRSAFVHPVLARP